nr:MAG TPA: hypothetical protein [Caudoviricetes sp.]
MYIRILIWGNYNRRFYNEGIVKNNNLVDSVLI